MASSVAQSSSMHHSSALTRSESQRGAGLALSLGNDPVSLVYAATNLGHTDWEMHVQLCDAINQIPSEGQRIIEAIKSRISSQNLEIAIQSVILLESVVKNCPGILPMLAVGNFMEQLVQALPKRVREPQKKSMIHFTSASKTLKKLEKAEKILLLIRSLAMAFDQNNQNNSPALARWNTADREKMKVFSEVYNTLLRTGVTFPSPAEDENVPIITPAAAPKPTGTSAATRSSPQSSSSSDNGGTGNTYTDAECRIAFESCKLLSDMLLDAVHSNAGRSHSELLSSLRSNDIISALVSNIRTAQNQFQIRLLEHQPSETIITQIISVNEIILKVFEFYRAIEDGKTDEKTMKSFALVASEENEAKSGQVQNSGKSKNGSVNAAQTKAAKRRSKDDDEKKERSPSKPDDQKTSFTNLLPLDLLSAPVSEPKKQSLSANANAPLALNPFMIPSAAPANANTLAPAASAHTSRSGGDHTPGSTPPPSPKHKAAMLHEHKPSADAAIDPFLAIATKSASPVATVDSVQPSSSALDSDSPAAGTPATPFDDAAATNTKALYDADVESRAPADDDDPFASIAARK